LTLGQSTHVHKQQRVPMWHTAGARSNPTRSYLLPTTLIPILLSLSLLVIPLLTAETGPRASAVAPRLNATHLSTEVIAMQAPAAEGDHTQSALTTTVFKGSLRIESTPPSPDTLVLAEPVPHPPSTSEQIR
jgi:hypothetical protein